MGILRVRRNFICTFSLVLGFGPTNSYAQDSDRDKIQLLQQSLCANPQPAAKDQVSENNTDTKGEVCISCDLKRGAVVNLRKIVSALAKEARIKREIQFLRYYGESPETNLPKLIATLTDDLTTYRMEKKSTEKNIAKAKLEREAYVKNEATIGKLSAGQELSKEERRSLVELLKRAIAGARSPESPSGTVPFQPPPHGMTPGQPNSKDSSLTHYGSKKEEAFNTFKESVKVIKRFADLNPLAKQVQDWLEKGDSQPPSDVSREDIANVLNNANNTRTGQYSHNEEFLKSLADRTRQAEAELEVAKKKQAEFVKSAPRSSYTQSDLTELENKFKHNIEKGNPGWKDCGLTVAETLALHDYTQNGYRVLNSALREGGARAEDLDHYTQTLKAALKKFRTLAGAVRRAAWLPDEALENHQEGAILPYPAFTSTSVNRSFQSPHRFLIVAKNGAYIAPYSNSYDEQEVIIPPGKFKVLSRTPGPNDTIEFVMQQVDD